MQKESKEYEEVLHLLIFDEFPAFITWLMMEDKKQATIIQSKITELLMLSRAYGFGIWMVMQRPDAKYIPDGAKDNFFVTVALGNLSKEGKSMIFSGYDIPGYIFSVGEGIAKIDGRGCIGIKYPRIRSEWNLNSQIIDALGNELETVRAETRGFSSGSSPDFT